MCRENCNDNEQLTCNHTWRHSLETVAESSLPVSWYKMRCLVDALPAMASGQSQNLHFLFHGIKYIAVWMPCLPWHLGAAANDESDMGTT